MGGKICGLSFFITETQTSTEGHEGLQQLGLKTSRHAVFAWRS